MQFIFIRCWECLRGCEEKKEQIKAAAAAAGMSMNEFIISAIEEKLTSLEL
ncbi:MAG: DUF1778 domain-containing protein [Eubacterium sp.]|nr:DUF1778 domain-containing protein [Eubacterium sp.]